VKWIEICGETGEGWKRSTGESESKRRRERESVGW
jgi:hypothetical protein